MKASAMTAAALAGVLLLGRGAAASDNSTAHIPLVEGFDLNRYLGTWYEIARGPHRFERGLVGVTATYVKREDGKILVINGGFKDSLGGRPSQSKGKAWVPDPATPARLRVSFFWPFAADYRVIALDTKDYGYAMVTSNSKDYLWILCRKPEMDDDVYQMLLSLAAGYGFDVSMLYKVPQ